MFTSHVVSVPPQSGVRPLLAIPHVTALTDRSCVSQARFLAVHVSVRIRLPPPKACTICNPPWYTDFRHSPYTTLRYTGFPQCVCFLDTHVLHNSPSRDNYAPHRNGVRNTQAVRNIRGPCQFPLSSIICCSSNGLTTQLPETYFCLAFVVLNKAVTWRRAVWHFKELPACINNLESSAYFLVGEDPSRAGGRIDVTSGNRNLQLCDEGRFHLNLQTNTTNWNIAHYIYIYIYIYTHTYMVWPSVGSCTVTYNGQHIGRRLSCTQTMDTTTTTARCCSEHKACQWRTEGGWGLNPPPLPKFRRPSKIAPNSTRLWKLLKIAEFRTPTPQDVPKKGSKILKLPSVRNCFTLAMTSKLVVINSLYAPKIKKILLHEMKFLVPNYRCLQNPYRPQIPVLSVLCPQPNMLNPPWTKFLGTPLDTTTIGRKMLQWAQSMCSFIVSCVRIYKYTRIKTQRDDDT